MRNLRHEETKGRWNVRYRNIQGKKQCKIQEQVRHMASQVLEHVWNKIREALNWELKLLDKLNKISVPFFVHLNVG